MLKKAASGVLAILPCSRTPVRSAQPKWLRPCWADFFEHSLQLLMAIFSWARICHGNELVNSSRNLSLAVFLRMPFSRGYNPFLVRYACLVLVPVFIHPSFL
jgi:hypothetical protein